MADERYWPWASLTIDEARYALADCPAPWWFTGGIALALFAGRSWRGHDDLDVGIRRRDAITVLDHLRWQGWELVVAAAGTLAPWDGGELAAVLHQNNVWCRRSGGAWQLDVTVDNGNDNDNDNGNYNDNDNDNDNDKHWVYRRDPALLRPWTEAVSEVDGVRFLAPELQLLFKSDDVRSKDTFDAEQVVPLLDGRDLALLTAQLPAGHPWRQLVRDHAPVCAAVDVHYVLDILRAVDLEAWIDGGWAVDALVGAHTRQHSDLDLAVTRASFDPALRALAEYGFETVRDDGRHNQVCADPAGRIVDLHAFDPNVVTVGADGLRRHGGDGLAYEADGFDGAGTIDGSAVTCVSPAALIRYHTGYDIDADDWHDVRLLCDRFDLPIPPDYEPFRSP